MDLNREILSLTSGLNHKPFSIIRSEVQRVGAKEGEYIKVRRILREWAKHFSDTTDDDNLERLEKMILCVGGSIISQYIHASKRSLYVPRDRLGALVNEYGPNLPRIIIDRIRRGEIDFPFKKYEITESELRETWGYIKSFTSSELSDR